MTQGPSVAWILFRNRASKTTVMFATFRLLEVIFSILLKTLSFEREMASFYRCQRVCSAWSQWGPGPSLRSAHSLPIHYEREQKYFQSQLKQSPSRETFCWNLRRPLKKGRKKGKGEMGKKANCSCFRVV